MTTLRQTGFPAHEELLLGSGLTAVVGALDAYTYLEHGAVFAGFQTGNLLLLGLNFGRLQLAEMGRYLTALLAFGIGIGLVQGLQHLLAKRQWDSQNVALWLDFSVLILVLATTDVVPNWVATALLSLAAAVELEGFRELLPNRNPRDMATTLLAVGHFRDRDARQRAKNGLAVMGSFALGAVLVAAFSKLLAGYTVLVPILLLAGLIFWQYQQNHRRKWKH
ncbi:DUF1275 family protein [Levilactobacillus lanxiensis]|uniref:DUF1275 family protein n=1 Tax=Levilactobacillus lanxiensis TaxID=2799568 RepID=A0ABW4CY40_9LACO|nr:YoaK family protein [Levilactobacillus lanxiensis]